MATVPKVDVGSDYKEKYGFFVPEDPTVRRGPKPADALLSQFEDVIVDARGYIYCTDKNHGLFVLRRAID